jgi:hypothetical protein
MPKMVGHAGEPDKVVLLQHALAKALQKVVPAVTHGTTHKPN